MAAPTDYYVDPAIAANSGAGTIGDPYGDLQHALNTVTRNATDGDRFNIKAGTDEVLTASLSLTTYGTTTSDAPLILQGYTSAQGDRGVGGIDCNSNSMFAATATDNIGLIDLHIHNGGSATLVHLDNYITIAYCEINNTSGDAVRIDVGGILQSCHIHDVGNYGLFSSVGDCTVRNSYFANGSKTFVRAINNGGVGYSRFVHNVFTLGGSSIGIFQDGFYGHCYNNSILSSGGTGSGIKTNSSSDHFMSIAGNLVEGFSGTGGTGIDLSGPTGTPTRVYGYNACYNNATNYPTIGKYFFLDEGDNESLGASPFAKSGSDTFANRHTYFAPVDTGNVIGGLPNGSDKGAVQSAPGGGGGIFVNTRRNSMIGR